MSLHYKIRRLYTFVVRFCYYGYHGAKYTYDFDAESLHNLIYAHMVRVNKYMHDDDLTHLVWNSNRDNKDMKLLREFTELSRRLRFDTQVGHYLDELFSKKSPLELLELMGTRRSDEYMKKFAIARKKDALIKKGLEDRYWYLLRYKVPGFWD